ncbi:hypothetical protein F9U64_10430 [Gracilibacillus oryzae]|uniref:Uncharacterized protein n=1 Tax=Gracilibacillus oryzae TaxID=1672701 RepID=A0A7C8GTB5_9BACI|nr:hypothetical protein [Gracilibacillus oryzae]KAB8136242.1 hypothetical protein F9U64_10430 [Gracilibacillus oryzae]
MDTFLIMWGIPAFMVIRGYLKMDDEDRKAVREDFTSPKFIFTIGFLVIGAFLERLGNITSIGLIRAPGMILLAVGGIITFLDLWGERKLRSLLFLLLISLYFLLSY